MNRDFDSPPSLVLDSWPVLEWLKEREPASPLFDQVIAEAEAGQLQLHMSRINRGEVLYSIPKAIEISNPDAAIRAFLAIPIHVHSVDDDLVDVAVQLKSKYAFAFADAFATALAIRLQVPVATGDREFRQLEADGLLELRWLGA